MDCPKCGGTLGKVTITKQADYGDDVLRDAERTDRIEVDQCLSCNGVWLDAGEMKQYLDEKLVILSSPRVRNYKTYDRQIGRCPRCGKTMAKKRDPVFQRITIDVCLDGHGIWLDSGEISHIQEKNLTFVEKNKLVFRNLKELLFAGSSKR